MTDSDKQELIAKTSSFQWNVNINRFEECDVEEYLVSPKFSTNNNSGFENSWQLLLYPKGELDKGYMSLFLEGIALENDASVEYYLSLLNQKNEKTNLKIHKAIFKHSKKSCWGSKKFVAESFVNDPQNKLIKDNKLRILCKIIVEKNCTQSNAKCLNELKVRFMELDKFEKLMTDNEFSDVTIIAEGKHFQLHKCILAASSDVFQAMFITNMKEKNENIVKIEDTSCEVLKELFRFIYSGKINDIEKIVDKLLVAAEKYCINGLKDLCEETLCNELKKNNAISYLNLAIMNNAEKLRREAIKLISLYLDVLIDEQELIDLDRQHPGVLHEIMRNCIENQI